MRKNSGIKVLAVQADVSAGADNEATVANVVKQAIDTFGRIDVLINNAARHPHPVSLSLTILQSSSTLQYIPVCMPLSII